MKKLAITSIISLAIAIALGFGFIPAAEQTASCADCNASNLNGIAKIFTVFAEECEKRAADSKPDPKRCLGQNIYGLILPVMRAFGKDNRFGPGDRLLFVGETQEGNLIAGANRGFNSVAPLNKDSLTVTVNKTDGRNGAIVKICTVDQNGNQTRVGTINFPEDGSEKETKSVTVTGVEGKVVHIDVASFGSPIRKFTYTLKTSQ